MLYLFRVWNQYGDGTFFGYFSRQSYVQPLKRSRREVSIDVAEQRFRWKITKIRSIFVLVSYPKHRYSIPNTGVLFLLYCRYIVMIRLAIAIVLWIETIIASGREPSRLNLTLQGHLSTINRGLQALSVQFRFAFSKPYSSQTRFLNRPVAAPAEVVHFCRYKKNIFRPICVLKGGY